MEDLLVCGRRPPGIVGLGYVSEDEGLVAVGVGRFPLRAFCAVVEIPLRCAAGLVAVGGGRLVAVESGGSHLGVGEAGAAFGGGRQP